MKVIAFITEDVIVDRIVDRLKLTFVADKLPPPHVFTNISLMAADELARGTVFAGRYEIIEDLGTGMGRNRAFLTTQTAS